MQEAQIRRVRAPNPSPMTGTGTNSYVLGQGRVAILDPGPDDPRHLAALLGALDPGETVEAILVSHAHLDHSALAPALSQATSAPVLAFGNAGSGRSPLMADLVAAGLAGGSEGIDHSFAPDRLLHDNDLLTFGDLQIDVLHCPGHMGGHLCFALGRTLFSGDHAMGWASSLVSPPDGDMGAYMASLDRLAQQNWSQMLPGHGETVADPAARLAELATHRRRREAEVLTALVPAPANAAQLATQIYHDTPAALLPAATRNVLAHLIDMQARNLISPVGPLTAATVFKRN